MLDRQSVSVLSLVLALSCGNPGASVPKSTSTRSTATTAGAPNLAALFQQKKVCHDLGVKYDHDQQKPLPAGSLSLGDDPIDLPSQYCYSTALNTCIWSGGSELRSGDGRNYTSRRVVDLLTNRELFEYSEHPLRRMNLINGFSPEERAREVSDMNAWSEARHEFERKNQELLRTCAP